MNRIVVAQNEESQLKLLRARSQLYVRAKRLMVLQFGLAVPVPVIGSLLAVFCPEARPFVALGALALPILDIALLDRVQRRLLKQAANIQEQFDCAVLELPWDTFTVGDRVDPDDVHEAATSYTGDVGKLRDWYPVAVAQAPLSPARIICQRTNLKYDSKLRRYHGWIVRGSAIVLVAILLVAGLCAELSLTDFVVSVLAPASPILIWSLREYFRQRDAADLLDNALKHAAMLWETASSPHPDADRCLTEARQLQNAIYTRRATSPLILPTIYSRKRSGLEGQMDAAALVWLDELERKGGAVPGA